MFKKPHAVTTSREPITAATASYCMQQANSLPFNASAKITRRVQNSTDYFPQTKYKKADLKSLPFLRLHEFSTGYLQSRLHQQHQYCHCRSGYQQESTQTFHGTRYEKGTSNNRWTSLTIGRSSYLLNPDHQYHRYGRIPSIP